VSAPAICVEHLTRTFGAVKAVQDISFTIEAGQVVGFIGANGAGKTTTMRILATLDLPDQGHALIGGLDVANEPYQVRGRVGWMPDAYGAYDFVTVYEYLDFFARAFGYRGAERVRRVHEVMEFTELTPLSGRYMKTLSKGMGQRLCLGRTLIHDPEVLILDEPAAGLDPKARMEFKRLVRLLAEEGKTLFISSHILSELEEMCDTLLFIDHGRIVHHGTADSLKHGHTALARIEVQVDGDAAAVRQWVEIQPGVRMVDEWKNGVVIELDSSAPPDIAACLRRMVESGLPVTEFHRRGARLEDAFVNLINRSEPPPL
jgi:ABC-2 type transport system ATP-binding protein